VKKPAPKLPPAYEWDFRQTDDLLLETVTLYEYARSNDGVREDTRRWLASEVEGKTLGSQLLAALRSGDGKRHRKLVSAHMSEGLKATRDWELFNLITDHRPDFPAPFFAYGKSPITINVNSKFSRVRIRPLVPTMILAKQACDEPGADGGTNLDFSQHLQICHYDSHVLNINWQGFTIQEILNDFEKWLRREAGKHAERKGKGKAGQRPTEPLKWLSAYRLGVAGFSFVKAQEEIELRVKNAFVKNPFLPIFSREASWSHAVNSASDMIKKRFSNRP
jgi:hypothetical protein